jgi:hypothetical protein
MKPKYLLYGLFGFALIFAGAAVALFYMQDEPGPISRGTVGRIKSAVAGRERSSPLPGGGGKAVIAYTGDIIGSLDPCG